MASRAASLRPGCRTRARCPRPGRLVPVGREALHLDDRPPAGPGEVGDHPLGAVSDLDDVLELRSLDGGGVEGGEEVEEKVGLRLAARTPAGARRRARRPLEAGARRLRPGRRGLQVDGAPCGAWCAPSARRREEAMDLTGGQLGRHLEQRLLEADDADPIDHLRRHAPAAAVAGDARRRRAPCRARPGRASTSARSPAGRAAARAENPAAAPVSPPARTPAFEPFVPRQRAGAGEVHLVVDALEGAPLAPDLDLSVRRSFRDELGMGEKAAAATRNRCEDPPVEPGLSVHPSTLASACDSNALAADPFWAASSTDGSSSPPRTVGRAFEATVCWGRASTASPSPRLQSPGGETSLVP